MTDAERRTLQELYNDYLWDLRWLEYGYNYRHAQDNDKKLQVVHDFITTHGITDDEVKDAIAPIEQKVREDWQKLMTRLMFEDTPWRTCV